jgi:hypothetical protein
MNDRIGRDLEECDLGLVEVLSQHLSEGTEEKTIRNLSSDSLFPS